MRIRNLSTEYCAGVMALFLPLTPGYSENLPGGVSLPWQYFNMPWEFVSREKNSFSLARRTWEREFLENPEPVPEYLQKRAEGFTAPLNLVKRLNDIRVSDLRAGMKPQEALAFQPALCPLGNRYLVLSLIIHRNHHRLLAAGHHVLPEGFLAPENSGNLASQLSEALRQSLRRSFDGLNLALVEKSDALQLGLRSAGSFTRSGQVAADCLNMLIAGALVRGGFTVTHSSGLEPLESLRLVETQLPDNMRNTRVILMDWSFPPAGHREQHRMPVSILLRARTAESVFGSPVHSLVSSEWLFAVSQEGMVQFSLRRDFTDFLNQEKKNLSYQDSPVIVKIHGAWIYTDRGRAWGLKMQDRLQVTGSDGKIKGHVVRFFGPELGLKNMDGDPIHEGAIIFVRKGQHLVRQGQSLDYDLTTYPTPWPPSGSP